MKAKINTFYRPTLTRISIVRTNCSLLKYAFHHDFLFFNVFAQLVLGACLSHELLISNKGDIYVDYRLHVYVKAFRPKRKKLSLELASLRIYF